MYHRLDLVEHLTARLTSLQVVVALLGLLEGEAAVDLEKDGESRGQVPSGDRAGRESAFKRRRRRLVASNDCLMYWLFAHV